MRQLRRAVPGGGGPYRTSRCSSAASPPGAAPDRDGFVFERGARRDHARPLRGGGAGGGRRSACATAARLRPRPRPADVAGSVTGRPTARSTSPGCASCCPSSRRSSRRTRSIMSARGWSGQGIRDRDSLTPRDLRSPIPGREFRRLRRRRENRSNGAPTLPPICSADPSSSPRAERRLAPLRKPPRRPGMAMCDKPGAKLIQSIVY